MPESGDKLRRWLFFPLNILGQVEGGIDEYLFCDNQSIMKQIGLGQ